MNFAEIKGLFSNIWSNALRTITPFRLTLLCLIFFQIIINVSHLFVYSGFKRPFGVTISILPGILSSFVIGIVNALIFIMSLFSKSLKSHIPKDMLELMLKIIVTTFIFTIVGFLTIGVLYENSSISEFKAASEYANRIVADKNIFETLAVSQSNSFILFGENYSVVNDTLYRSRYEYNDGVIYRLNNSFGWKRNNVFYRYSKYNESFYFRFRIYTWPGDYIYNTENGNFYMDSDW